MNEIIKVNLSKKSEEIQNSIEDTDREDYDNKNTYDFSQIANDFSNLCAFDNRLKLYIYKIVNYVIKI